MKTKDAVEFYGSVRKIAKVLDLSTSAVYAWDDVVPELSAHRLVLISGGDLLLGDDYSALVTA